MKGDPILTHTPSLKSGALSDDEIGRGTTKSGYSTCFCVKFDCFGVLINDCQGTLRLLLGGASSVLILSLCEIHPLVPEHSVENRH